MKSEKVEKRVGVITKSGPNKIIDLKLMSDFIVNCLIGTIIALRNPTSDTVNKADITIANFLADIIANLFGLVLSVNFFGIFVIFANFFVQSSSLANLIVANPINIYGDFVHVFTCAKPSIHIAVVHVDSTIKVSVIANSYNVGLTVNFFALFGPSIVFIVSSANGGSITNLRVANLIIDIYDNFISVSTHVKYFTNVFVVFVSFIIDIGIVSNLFANVLAPIKLFIELAPNTTYKEWSIYTSGSTSNVFAAFWHC